jgi:IS605 OrfB family transposase
MLKREKLKRLPQKVRLQARYNAHTFKFYPEKTVSLTTANGRQKFHVYIPDYFKQYLTGTYTSAQLIVKKGQAFLNIQSEIDGNAIDTNSRILGIDRGILNIVTCEDNTFVNAKHLRAVKGEYRYLKAKLQSLGTRSAKRKLQKLAGRERRFVLDTNHCISKMLVNKPYGIYVLEELHIERKKKNGRRFNSLLGNWSPGQLLSLLWYKAESAGKLILLVDPRHTSQKCSRCGYRDRRNRKGRRFHCLQCGYQLNADLNAARNIGRLGRALLVRLPKVNEPIVAHSGTAATSPHALAMGS